MTAPAVVERFPEDAREGATLLHAWFGLERGGAVLGAPLGETTGTDGTLRRFAHVEYPRSLSWLVYWRAPRWYEREMPGCPPRVLVAEPIHKGNAHAWPGPERSRCHTTDRGHPWNEGAPEPGYERCGVCGRLAWHEIHGVADGQCAHCGHGG